MSRPAEDRAIVDAGLKALAFDSGPPLVCDEAAATYERASDEHGRLAGSAATCLRAPQRRRAALADHRPRHGVLKLVAQPYRRQARSRRFSRCTRGEPCGHENAFSKIEGYFLRVAAKEPDQLPTSALAQCLTHLGNWA